MMKQLSEVIKHAMWNAYLRSPQPLSKYMYALADTIFLSDERARYFERAFASVSSAELTGDYLEFGVYKGASIVMVSKLAKKYNLSNMRFFAFDSFEGLPISEVDWLKKGEYACSQELFERIVTKAGVDRSRTIIVKGLYSDTLNESTKRRHGLVKAAIVHIDCDLYSSTSEVLKFIENVIDDGTVIIFDDWYIYGQHNIYSEGEGKAFIEWPLNQYCHELFDLPGRSKAFVFSRSRSGLSEGTARRR